MAAESPIIDATEVDLPIDDDKGHDQGDDRFLDTELKEVDLVIHCQEVRHAGNVVGQHDQQAGQKEPFPAAQSVQQVMQHR